MKLDRKIVLYVIRPRMHLQCGLLCFVCIFVLFCCIAFYSRVLIVFLFCCIAFDLASRILYHEIKRR